MLGMPEWLLKDENYIPQLDKDTFITKSILSLLGIISMIKTQSEYKQNKFKINTDFKITFTFMLILMISITNNFTFIIIINIYLLVILSIMKSEEIIKIFKISFIICIFTFGILLPAAFCGNSFSSVMITSKVFATVTAVNILSCSAGWDSITSTLKRFFVPNVFIFVMDITIKYIFIMGEFSLNMMYSLKLRSVGKNKNKYISLSGIIGIMFIKSKEMAEDMYFAMECRGFTGEYYITNNRLKFSIVDFIYIIINFGIMIIFIYGEGLK